MPSQPPEVISREATIAGRLGTILPARSQVTIVTMIPTGAMLRVSEIPVAKVGTIDCDLNWKRRTRAAKSVVIEDSE